MHPPFIATPQVILRALEPEDAPIVAACNNDPEVRASFFTHTPTSIARETTRIATFYQPGADYIPLAICLPDSPAAVGVTAYHRIDLVSRAAVYSICIADPAARGKRLAEPVTRSMLHYAFDILNLHRVQLHVWTQNERAFHTYEKCGFRIEGTLREAMKHNGVYCDFHVMGILEDEWRSLRKT